MITTIKEDYTPKLKPRVEFENLVTIFNSPKSKVVTARIGQTTRRDAWRECYRYDTQDPLLVHITSCVVGEKQNMVTPRRVRSAFLS